MLLMGDEGRRTQGGNNNAYCQNSETSWLDWSLNSHNEELGRFVACLVRLRFGSEVSSDRVRLSLEQYEVEAHYEWHGIELGKPDWKDDSHAIAFTLHTGSLKRLLYVAVNAFWEPLSFALPASNAAGPLGWQRLVDTSLASPNDIVESESGVVVTDARYLVNSRSIVVLQTSLS